MVICFGTRPEWLKVKSVYENISSKLLFTGQHEDLISGVTPDMSLKINNSNNRLDDIVSSCLLNFPDFNDDTVMVQGDTSSAYACAIAAYHRGKKIIHLEAGLRSNDLRNPYPEEGYRQMISRISDVNLCPTSLSKNNLIKEGVKGEVFVTGNTILDLIDRSNCVYGNNVIVTMHRRENKSIMVDWFKSINNIAKNSNLNFIFVCHPSVKHLTYLFTHVDVIESVDHESMINMLRSCRFIISDSGGLQEEGSYLNKKIIVCRKTTEREEGIASGHVIMCKSPEKMNDIFNLVSNNYEINAPCPFGDGDAYKKIKTILEK